MDSLEAKTDSRLKRNQPGLINQKLTGVSDPFYIEVESELPSKINKDFPFNVVFGCPLTQSISISQREALCTYVTFKQWSRAATTATNDVAVQAHAPKMSPALTQNQRNGFKGGWDQKLNILYIELFNLHLPEQN